MPTQESLRVPIGAEAAHFPFLFASMFMADFSTIFLRIGPDNEKRKA